MVGPHVRSGYPKEAYLRRNVINPIRRSGRKEREKMNKRAVGGLVLVAVVLIALPLGAWYACQSPVIEKPGNVTTVIPTILPTVNVYKPNVSRDFGCQKDHILPLGDSVYASVCRYGKEVIVDIRVFLTRSQKLYPTVKGINLNSRQWESLKTAQHAVDVFIDNLM